MKKAEKVKTKFYSRIPFLLDPGKKISKKNSKKIQKITNPLPGIFFLPKRDEIGRKSENKILLQNSVHTRPRQENSEKNSKKMQKISKPLPGIIFSPNGIRYATKAKTKFCYRIPFILDPGKKFLKKIVKKFKKL